MKSDLRKALLARRKALSAERRVQESRAIMDRLRDLPAFRAARTIVGYAPQSEEVDILPLLAELAKKGRTVALPRTVRPTLEIFRWKDGDPLVPGPFGIREPSSGAGRLLPSEVDLVLVPGVAFDRRGHRLGFGHGYYDRFLSAIPDAAQVGVAFTEQLVDRVPDEPHDVTVDWLVLPDETVKCDPSV